MTTQTNPRKTKTFRGTWCGRHGVSVEYFYEKNPRGKRIVSHQWDGETTITLRAISGDFWKAATTAVEYGAMVVNSHSDIDAAVRTLAHLFTEPVTR